MIFANYSDYYVAASTSMCTTQAVNSFNENPSSVDCLSVADVHKLFKTQNTPTMPLKSQFNRKCYHVIFTVF